MTSAPASGMALRTSVSRWSAARSTEGIHSPRGSRAVRQAWLMASLVIGSPSRAAISSPALVRQRMLPLYERKMTGRTTLSASALPYP